MNKTVVSHRIHPFCSDMIQMRCVHSSLDPQSGALVGINNTSVFCLAFPKIAVGLSTVFIGIVQGIAAGIGTSNFLQTALIMSFNSSSSGSMKYIPLN